MSDKFGDIYGYSDGAGVIMSLGCPARVDGRDFPIGITLLENDFDNVGDVHDWTPWDEYSWIKLNEANGE